MFNFFNCYCFVRLDRNYKNDKIEEEKKYENSFNLKSNEKITHKNRLLANFDTHLNL